jgi:hypothetical protein
MRRKRFSVEPKNNPHCVSEIGEPIMTIQPRPPVWNSFGESGVSSKETDRFASCPPSHKPFSITDA